MMTSSYENAPKGMVIPPLNEPTAPKTPSDKVVVIGLYGVPGSGKTFLLNQLRQELGQMHFAFYEGSEMIATLVPGGLNAFQNLEEQEKVHWRQLALHTVRQECANRGKVAVIVGHFMFWSEGEEVGQPVYTQGDLDTFTHIIYLDIPAEVVAQRRLDDMERSRPSTSATHLYKWQQAEKTQLRHLCLHNRILFFILSPHTPVLNKVSTLLEDFRRHTEEYNLSCAKRVLDEALATGQGQLETLLVMDADRTLNAVDTGNLFWEKVSSSRESENKDCSLKTLFSSPQGYSYTAFRQAVLMYEEVANDQEFDALCQNVSSTITIHPEFLSLLRLVAKQKHVGAVVITCGLRRIWEMVLEREGLSKTVKVIGGGRVADGYVVTAAVKAKLVARVRETHQMYVFAFGDSPLDLEMLGKADRAIVVVGEEQTRSKTMDVALLNAIDNEGLRAHQALLPSNASPRLNTIKLPLIQFTEPEFVDAVLCHRHRLRHASIRLLHATGSNAAKLLMTATRDASLAGPVLREAHRRMGYYLAIEFLGEIVGLEKYPIPHVQGGHASGYRLSHEEQTLIVPLMRGGEPMALGVNDAYPLAMFIHAINPGDIMFNHLQGQSTIVLVDSVVNSGKTVVEFVQHIRNLHATIRIVVIVGVIQAQSVSEGSIAQALSQDTELHFIALRLSDNRFTGRGATDTGNRLFNTTHLP